jgi:hypothetical protein
MQMSTVRERQERRTSTLTGISIVPTLQACWQFPA